MSGINYTLGLQANQFQSALQKSMGGLRALGGVAAKIAAPVAAIAGVTSLGVAIGKSVSAAANLETLQTSFQPLLGSAQAAQERLAELSQFAASTPFELPAIATASRTLETLTRGALSTGDGLRAVGDVAAATGQPFDAIATTIGRLYDGLDSGRPVGEALARLQELGVISGDTRGQLEALQASGAKGPEVWAVAQNALGRFSGSMELQSATWSGKMSTLRDNITNAFAAFGTPILDTIKPFLDQAIAATQAMTAKAVEFGKKVAEAITFLRAAFASGQLTTLVAESLKIGFFTAVNHLWKTLRATIAAAGQYLVEAFHNAIALFGILTTGDFWKGMGNAIHGIFLTAIATLQKGLAEALELARPLAKIFGKEDSIDRNQEILRLSGELLQEDANAKFADAGDALTPALQTAQQRLAETFNNVTDAFNDAYATTADAIDTSANRAKLDAAFAAVREEMERLKGQATPETTPAAAIAAEETPPPGEAAAEATRTARQTSADRLSQIGGYLSGIASSTRDRLAERTENWTRLTAQAVQKLANRPTTPNCPNCPTTF